MELKGTQIAIVDDDSSFRSGLTAFLEKKGAFVSGEADLNGGRDMLGHVEPRVLLLDKELANYDGFTLIHEIRSDEKLKTMSIIVISGTCRFEDRLEAFRIGADDLLIKPFEMAELEARILAQMRRSASYLPEEQELHANPFYVNMRSHDVYFNNKLINLTETEYRIFIELVSNKNQLVRRSRLSQKALSTRHTGPKTLNVHIAALRKKLGKEAGELIQTIRGLGFKIVIDDVKK